MVRETREAGRAILADEVRPAVSLTYQATEAEIASLEVIMAEVNMDLALAVVDDYTRTEAMFIEAMVSPNPGILELLVAIWEIFQAVVTVGSAIIQILQLLDALGVDEMISRVWPEFGKKLNQFRNWWADVSEWLDFGRAGLGLLTSLGQLGIGVANRLRNDDERLIQVEWLDNTQEILSDINFATGEFWLPGILNDSWFGASFDANFLQFTKKISEWSVDTLEKITGVTNDLEIFSEQTQGILDEFLDLRDTMPAVVAKHIPQSIWDKLDHVNRIFADAIVPALNKVNNRIKELSNTLDSYADRMQEIAEDLNHPGDVLDSVNSLEGDVLQDQVDKIDQVTSIKQGQEVDAEIYDYAGDLEQFDLVDAAVSAATPSPRFMTLEAPERKKALGITVEAQETWFVGGYKTPY